jgi:hypothetical protein
MGRIFIDIDRASMHAVVTPVIYFLKKKLCTAAGIYVHIFTGVGQ